MISAFTEVRLSAELVDAPEVCEHGGYNAVRIGPWFVPVEISWWAYPDATGTVAGVQLYGARENGRIPNTVYRRGSSSIPSWVPAPPMGWDAFEAMVDGRAPAPKEKAS